uniref:Uncharacterized protein n=1 Tax=Globodera rostochiensis TaxID=31243 RepID=A0A914HHH5_GLORO
MARDTKDGENEMEKLTMANWKFSGNRKRNMQKMADKNKVQFPLDLVVLSPTTSGSPQTNEPLLFLFHSILSAFCVQKGGQNWMRLRGNNGQIADDPSLCVYNFRSCLRERRRRDLNGRRLPRGNWRSSPLHADDDGFSTLAGKPSSSS